MENRKSLRSKILEDLSRNFVGRRIVPDYMEDPEQRAAYRAYYGEVSFAKGWELVSEIRYRNGPALFSGRKTLRLADIGTGTGDFLRGLLGGLGEWGLPASTTFDLLCVDRSSAALKEIWNDRDRVIPPGLTASLRVAVAALPGQRRFMEQMEDLDLLSMANVLAENPESLEDFSQATAEMSDRLRPGGVLLLVEPADRISSRRLLELGDRLLLHRPFLEILAPCPNGRTASCPALADPDNWCHEDRPAIFSPELLKMASALGHVKDALKMTYLLLRSPGLPQMPSMPPVLRLVSELHREKGLSWGMFCDGTALVRGRLLNRNRSDGTRAFLRLERGEVIAAPDPASMGSAGSSALLDWTKESPVRRLYRPNGEPRAREGADEVRIEKER